LAERGHGGEWRRVLHVGAGEWRRLWEAIFGAVQGASIAEVRVEEHGVGCAVVLELAIGARSAEALSAWHYSGEGSAPRLVTAYPRPYNRGHGRNA
jgi:hypothetical protein